MKKVVGIFENRLSHVTLVSKGAIPMTQRCDKCSSEKIETVTRYRYTKASQAIVVTNVPCAKCRCDEHFSMITLLTIESKIGELEFDGPMIVEFEKLKNMG